MHETSPNDPYNCIVIHSETDFELVGYDDTRNQEFGVTLRLNDMAGFILMAHLASDRPYWQSEIRDSEEFAEVAARNKYAVGRTHNKFIYQFSRLRFTLNALDSTLFRDQGYGATQVFWRSPDYEVIDRRI